VRETAEEVGLDLERARWLRELPHRYALAHDLRRPMAIAPHVFALDGPPPPLRLNHEVAEAVWTPLAALRDPARRSTLERRLPGFRLRFASLVDPAGRVIWGLTLGMIEDLLKSCACSSPAGLESGAGAGYSKARGDRAGDRRRSPAPQVDGARARED